MSVLVLTRARRFGQRKAEVSKYFVTKLKNVLLRSRDPMNALRLCQIEKEREKMTIKINGADSINRGSASYQ